MPAATIITDVARLLLQLRWGGPGRQAEQLAGRSRSRLPPFGRRYAKPPAAALLTGQVARELASTLKRLRLVRSFHLPWPGRPVAASQLITVLQGRGRFTALANRLGLGFVVSRQLYEAWADFSQRAHADSRFLGSGHVDQIGAKIGTRTSMTKVQPLNRFGGYHLLWSKYAIGAPRRTEQSIALRVRREH